MNVEWLIAGLTTAEALVWTWLPLSNASQRCCRKQTCHKLHKRCLALHTLKTRETGVGVCLYFLKVFYSIFIFCMSYLYYFVFINIFILYSFIHVCFSKKFVFHICIYPVNATRFDLCLVVPTFIDSIYIYKLCMAVMAFNLQQRETFIDYWRNHRLNRNHDIVHVRTSNMCTT